jgi:NCAIR mutase (PurE)-related protein
VIRADAQTPQTGGRIAVITAGSSDVPVASEAALIACEMGCEVRSTWDVGVAGIHRLVRPLEQMVTWDADVFIVAAGMDGILPAIVSGLVSQPVIGLPVSTGYGFGGQGVGAMTTMLQTCSPGLAVVNIDNGLGAGITAGRIANRAALNRAQRSS